MVTLKIPLTVHQLLELVRQLSPEERRKFVDSLLAERFDAALTETDQNRDQISSLTDEEIQTEVDAVRRQRRQERLRAAGG